MEFVAIIPTADKLTILAAVADHEREAICRDASRRLWRPPRREESVWALSHSAGVNQRPTSSPCRGCARLSCGALVAAAYRLRHLMCCCAFRTAGPTAFNALTI